MREVVCMSDTSKRIASAAGGALMHITGYDTTFPLPKMVHYALAGIAVDVGCTGVGESVNATMEFGFAAIAGIIGASIAERFMPGMKLM